VRLGRQRKAAALGWLVRVPGPLAEDRVGLAVSTFGKVIKRGWEWLGLTPGTPERLTGGIEVPALAQSLTLNKADFTEPEVTDRPLHWRGRRGVEHKRHVAATHRRPRAARCRPRCS
jgi:hypothetical protein